MVDDIASPLKHAHESACAPWVRTEESVRRAEGVPLDHIPTTRPTIWRLAVRLAERAEQEH